MKFKIKKMILLSAKIGLGVSVAIYIAQLMKLENAASAGTITLLTLITTRWETFRLSLKRLIMFGVSVFLCWGIFTLIPSMWLAFGVFLFIMVLITEGLGWRSTLSVNTVIGTHFLISQDFSFPFIVNELLLVVLGIAIAIFLNLFHINSAHENGIVQRMRHVEEQMKQMLTELAQYLRQQTIGDRVWDDLVKLESEGYSVEVVSYNPIKVRLFSSKKCKECNHCYYVFRHLCKLKPNNNNTVNPNDTSCSFFEEKKKCEDCEGYCPPKHPDSLGACRKHEFRSCSGNRERCYDFVDKHTYFLCKHYRGDGDGEYEFCIKENVTGRRCSMQSTCPHFEKAYVPSKKDWTKCAALVSMGDEQTYFCRRCGGVGAYCKKENCSSVMEKIS